MRVLLVTGSYPPMHCGVGDYTRHLAQFLAEHADVHVAVLTSRAVAAETDGSVELFCVVDNWRYGDVSRILGVLWKWRPDIVHIQYPTQGYGSGCIAQLLPLLCKLAGFRVVQTWHEYRAQFTARSTLWLLTQIGLSGGVIYVRPRFEATMPALLRASLLWKRRAYIPNASVLPTARLVPDEKESIKERYGRAGARLVAYFGFIYPAKGVESLFAIADPTIHHLVVVGEFKKDDPYHRAIAELADSASWRGKVTITGFLPAEEASRVLSAADAVVLPFVSGGGEWNSSIHAIQAQGTFVVTTSTEQRGYNAAVNTYFAAPGNIDEMRRALVEHVGRASDSLGLAGSGAWKSISESHLLVYRRVMGEAL